MAAARNKAPIMAPTRELIKWLRRPYLATLDWGLDRPFVTSGAYLLAIGVSGQGPSAFIEHEKTGLLIEPKSVPAITASILAIDHDRQRMQQIAAAGAAHIRANFTWDEHARRLIDVYREVLPK